MPNYPNSENPAGLDSLSATSLADGDIFVVGDASETPSYKLKGLLKSELMMLCSGVIPKTYAQLAAMVLGATLVPWRLYEITDFQTKHQIALTSVIHTGNTEAIIVLALTTSKFAYSAWSTVYPQDILEYDFADNLCEDGTTPRTGWITKRTDTTLKIECAYDFRNVVWRRWAISTSTYSAGTTYAENNICRSASKIWKSIHAGNIGNTPGVITAAHWTLLVDEGITSCVLPDPAGYSALGNANCSGDAATHADFYTFVLQGLLTVDSSNSGYFKNIKMLCGYTNDGNNSLRLKTGNNNVFIVSSSGAENRGCDGNWLEGCYDNTFITDHMFDNHFYGDMKWGVFAQNVITVFGSEDFFANVFEAKGNCNLNTFSGGSIHNNFFRNMNAVVSNSFATAKHGNSYGFYNNTFMNCGHVRYNIFSDVSSLGIFSLYVLIGGDMETNVFATDTGFDTIIWNICYHFSTNVFITTGHIYKTQFRATGSMSNNTNTAGCQDIVYNVAGDLSGKTLTPVTGTNYSTAVTALP